MHDFEADINLRKRQYHSHSNRIGFHIYRCIEPQNAFSHRLFSAAEMRRWLIATSAVAAGAVTLAALAAGQRGDTGSAAKPRLSVDFTPFVVAGSGFRAGETVRVIVRGAVASTRTAKASGAGRISVRFPGLGDDCPRYLIITATGDKGSRAQFRRMPPACGNDPGRA
jgi:hypothetical protein